MTLRELLPAAPFPRVLAVLERHYAEVPADKVERLFRRLEALPPAAEAEEPELEVSITALRPGEEEDGPVDRFDEDDTALYYDVSAIGAERGRVYSIAGLNCAEFLALGVSENTLRAFTPPNIVAHCLWEVTAYTWDPDNRA